ncbi:sugar phosphate isomerase/epimerase family protein [Streptomyces sp. NPDC013455]|uniref:sugar phosphate isomerase/epimerase family protein n=1 Tax=Streptomyces sp. NPDC013455 TaxID=3155605 RepID=UPI0033ECE901
MKLAVIGDELSQNPVLVADTAAQLGFAGVEVRSYDETPPHELTDDQIDHHRRLLDERGLAVAGFAPPIFKGPLPTTDDQLAEARRVLVDSCRRAVRLGAPHARIFSFFTDTEHAPEPRRAAEAVAALLEGVDPGLPLVLETESRSNTPHMREVLDFLDALGRDDIGVLWDPANAVRGGWGPVRYPSDYLMGRHLIRHVHVKDPDGTNGYVRLGDGDLDWPTMLARLADDGYTGFLSLETHWRHGRVLSPVNRDRPWGEDFSRDGFAASVECMQLLRALCDRLPRELLETS